MPRHDRDKRTLCALKGEVQEIAVLASCVVLQLTHRTAPELLGAITSWPGSLKHD